MSVIKIEYEIISVYIYTSYSPFFIYHAITV